MGAVIKIVSHLQGVLPQGLEKVKDEEIKDIISVCIQLEKDDRPSVKELLQMEFFQEDIGFKLEILDRDVLIDNANPHINFRLHVTDIRKKKPEKGGGNSKDKDKEAIEFEFNLDADSCNEITMNMVRFEHNF